MSPWKYFIWSCKCKISLEIMKLKKRCAKFRARNMWKNISSRSLKKYTNWDKLSCLSLYIFEGMRGNIFQIFRAILSTWTCFFEKSWSTNTYRSLGTKVLWSKAYWEWIWLNDTWHCYHCNTLFGCSPKNTFVLHTVFLFQPRKLQCSYHKAFETKYMLWRLQQK